MPAEGLAPELRSLVKQSVALLGEVIREELGRESYEVIEAVRREMTRLRKTSPDASYTILRRELERLRGLSKEERRGVAHAFALMLELMNACENAYRTWRLRDRLRQDARGAKAQVEHRPRAIIYVLTAHPTEARSPQVIAAFHEIQRALVQWLDEQNSPVRRHEAPHRVQTLLHVTWKLSLARRRKPSVSDEAESIFAILLRNETLRALIAAHRELAPVFIRTWVGGDKDGHPGVDETKLQQSLQASRRELLRWFERGLDKAHSLSNRLGDAALSQQILRLKKQLPGLRVLRSGDGGRVLRLRSDLKRLPDVQPVIADLGLLLQIFPGLVVPVELRESSDLIEEAARGKPSAISRMVARVGSLSRGGDPKWYARGLIISMASSLEHVRAAAKVVRRELGELRLPVIPLFEQNDALVRAPKIAAAMLADPMISRALRDHWSRYFEVMVGYSDSAKETGVLKSRLAIAQGIHALDALYRKKPGLVPVFFHGSGGSTDRGGGSIEEQTAWWPESALNLYKATIQGETIERSFASPEITRRRLAQIAGRISSSVPASKSYRPAPILDQFAKQVAKLYQSKITSPGFLEIVQRGTAYRYLSDLRIGSRPAKRGKFLSVGSLRAIPWVLCWTQTRVLFPTWWGVGTAWRDLSRETDRVAMRREFERDPLFGSYVKVLSSTLARVELPVWRLYLEESGLPDELVRSTLRDFERELRLARTFVKELTGESDLLWFKPWLGESIRLRSPMIHPLNLLQILTLQEKDALLIRETVMGISSGMLTTG